MSIQILKMDSDVTPEDNATAEILNTIKINALDEVTICGRFRTPYLPFTKDVIQNLVFLKDMWMLFKLDMHNCEYRYDGCTKYYRDKLGKN